MSHRHRSLLELLQSPARILGIVLVVVFAVEVAVMLVLPSIVPKRLGETRTALLDALMLTIVCAPALWWIIIGPLRRIAIEERQRSETIVANASEGILTFDDQDVIVSCNRAGEVLFGHGLGSMAGTPLHRSMPDFPERLQSLPADLELDGVRFDGIRFPLQVSVSEYPSQSPHLRIAIFRDLTDSQAAEQQRIASVREKEALRGQQMATLAQLATGVAHEVRNPLTSIKMLIQVNRAKLAEGGWPTDDLELVEQEIRRMERSVNSLLEYARPERADFRPFDIRAAVEKTTQLIGGRCAAQGVHLEWDAPKQPAPVIGDDGQIRQLLLNLVLNALDAMPAGGLLRISVSVTDEHVSVRVTDTGGGIDSSVLEKLFAPFVTTKPSGVGLGLGICRRIAEEHHGSVVGANRDGGAEFLLTLPLATQP